MKVGTDLTRSWLLLRSINLHTSVKSKYIFGWKENGLIIINWLEKHKCDLNFRNAYTRMDPIWVRNFGQWTLFLKPFLIALRRLSKLWDPIGRSHTDFELDSTLRGRPRGLWSFGLAVLEADFSRSEFWLEIKILLCKSTTGNTKMASEFELDAKWKNFICKILDRSINSGKSIGFTNKNVLFGDQFKFWSHFRVPRGRFA